MCQAALPLCSLIVTGACRSLRACPIPSCRPCNLGSSPARRFQLQELNCFKQVTAEQVG